MHDIDRTLTELESEYESGLDGDQEWEEGYQDTDAYGEFESEEEFGKFEAGEESLLGDQMEMELASDLLNVSSEEELEQFLGKLFRSVKRGLGKIVRVGRRFFKSTVGRRLGRILKGVARKVLPIAGTAIGGFFGGPAGAAVGGRLLPAADRIFGLELEGLSPEDQEFETARRFVRMAAAAAANAARGSPTAASPQQIVRSAFASAARRHAPGLLRPGAALGHASGRWVRRGRTIVLLGV